MATSSSRHINSNDADNNGESWSPETDAEREAIRRQLDRILASDLFAQSKRYPSLLKHIVEETLAERASFLKERTLGVEVFGRDPSYDSNLDPVVRTSAAQVRHRLSQYYDEPRHQREIRIELLPGSYVPQFRRPAGEAAPTQAAAPPAEGFTLPALPQKSSRWKRLIAAGAFIALAGLAWVVLTPWLASGPVAAFWGPVWDKSRTVLICVPGNFPTPENPIQTSGVATPDRAPGAPLTISESQRLNSITWPDATTLYTLVGFVQSHGQEYRVRRERDLPFSDLRTGPVLMVGGRYNNQWVLRLTSRYRFTYERENGKFWISDSRNPSRKDWVVDVSAPYSSFDVDYGIVSRVWDPTIGHWIVVASGIASYGTIAAGEFLTNPEHLATLAQTAPQGWERKNIQVVFATRVFNGNAGPPHILAVHVW